MADTTRDDLPLSSFLTYKLNRVAQMSNRAGARWHDEASGLTLSEWRILAMLGSFGASSPSDIANRTQMDKAVISRVKTALAKKGLITDEADSTDSRKRILDLTEDGRQLFVGVMPRARKRQMDLMELFSEQELQVLNDGFDRLQMYFERQLTD